MISILVRGGLPSFTGIFTGCMAVGLFTFLWQPYMELNWFQIPWPAIKGHLIDASLPGDFAAFGWDGGYAVKKIQRHNDQWFATGDLNQFDIEDQVLTCQRMVAIERNRIVTYLGYQLPGNL